MPRRERWRKIRRAPGYKVSSLGRVRSMPRQLADGRSHGGGDLIPYPDADGYLCVTLYGETVKLHHLVLEAFHGPRPYGMEGCHGFGGKLDNSAEVLRWDTHKENIRDKERNNQRQPERLNLHCDTIPAVLRHGPAGE